MMLNRVSNISFTAGYDVHVHSGHWWVNSSKNGDAVIETSPGNYASLKNYTSVDIFENANKLLTSPDDKMEKMFISNLDCMVRNHPDISKSSITENGTPFLSDEIKGNTDLLNIYKEKPNYILYATCQPGFGKPENIEKIIRTAPDKFKGLKFHPKQLNLRADDLSYDGYLKLAQKYKLPCLFHSQVNIDYTDGTAKIVKDISKWDKSDPEFIYNLAKRHPDVPVIMAHTGAGGKLAHQKAINVLLKSIDNNDAKLYCDISWVDFENGLPAEKPDSIINLIKELKNRNALDRIMFGTDAPLGCYGESIQELYITPQKAYKMTVDNLKNIIRKNFGNDAETIINKVFYENAHKIFFKNTTRQIKNTMKRNYKILILFFTGITAIRALFFANGCINKQTNEKLKKVQQTTLSNTEQMYYSIDRFIQNQT